MTRAGEGEGGGGGSEDLGFCTWPHDWRAHGDWWLLDLVKWLRLVAAWSHVGRHVVVVVVGNARGLGLIGKVPADALVVTLFGCTHRDIPAQTIEG